MNKINYFRQLIKEELYEICSPSLVDGWFLSLSLHYEAEKNILTIIFPHVFFENWFIQNYKKFFEQAVSKVFQKEHRVPPQTSYKQPKQENNSASFFHKTQKEKDFFVDFIYNNKNKFPLSVARELAQNPFSTKYTPVFFYGKSSTGKTQLLQCIKQSIYHNYGQEKQIFLERTENFCKAFQEYGVQKFFESKDVFLWDDIQNNENLQQIQSELIHLIELCAENNKLLIFTGTLHPQEQKNWSETLRSRLNCGLLVQIKNSDIDVRMRYTVNFCRNQGIKLHKEDILLVAQQCANISILKGVLLKIQAYALQSAEHLQHSDIKNILLASGEEEKNLSAQDILSFIAQYFEMNEDHILGDVRKPDIVHARQMAMFLCRDLLGLSYPTIGKFFGGKDHSTVMYGIKKIKQLTDRNKDMQMMVTDLRKKCMAL